MAKQHLRVDGTDDDILISSLITQAREYCEDYQKKKYITQTLELVLDEFPNIIEFKACSPVQSVTSIKYIDENSVEQTIDPSNYIVDTDSFVARVVPRSSWPMTNGINSVRVRFVAGYGNESAVPESVKWAMVLHMRTLYDDLKPEEQTKLEKARDNLLGMRRVVNI